MGAVGGDEFARPEGLEAVAEEGGGGGGGGRAERIVVSVRLRPLSEKEIARNDPCDWECINDTTIIFRNCIPERAMFPTAYTFDRVFWCDRTTRQVYQEAAKEVALSVVSGINASIFAYGQTSSGKTYTMSGITEYTVADVYDYIHRHEERAFVLKFSAMEIYNEAVKDLLSTDSTPLRLLDDPEKGTIVEKLTEEILRDWNHLKELISVCEAQRKIGETSLNETSSRSHQILKLTIESSAREFLGRENSSTLVANVNFVDLAGSERASQALSIGARLKEGCHINRSLLTLGTVIRKLSKGRNSHIPYRDSKLTRILQPSLGGNSRTAIICTMSPARSHIEQSKNTLLFASCAREVVTSAQVNVVMSDKALVKHLQKELARLESELRYPRTSSGIEAVIKERDAQIKKMEKQIKELIQQRDLAQTRLEDLLQAVGDGCASTRWEESSRTLTFQVPYTCEDVLSASESSDVADHDLDFGSAELGTSDNKHYLHVAEKQAVVSPRHPVSSLVVGLLPHHNEGEIGQNPREDFEDICKEVRCIEMNETSKSEDSESFLIRGNKNLLHLSIDSYKHGDRERRLIGQRGLRPLSANPLILEQHLQNVRDTFNSLVKTYPDGSSLWSSAGERSKFRGLYKSRSCGSTLMSSSSWFQEAEQNDCMPPDKSLKDFSGKPEGLQRRQITLKYDAEMERLSREGSQISGPSALEEQSVETNAEGNIGCIDDFVAELKEMAKVQHQKQCTGGQEVEPNANEDIGAEGTVRSIGLYTILDPFQSPSRWLLEFERKQQEIIELWHACNVSLVHRTYFFLLFKGDPTDSIYMEVELRRLSFLKNTYSQGNLDKTADGSQITAILSSTKKLRRERQMLCRRMQKRLSVEERECLYTKWGIALDSKQRRLQLARCLWTETGDLEHIRESASLVASLVGLLEPGQALKEMFGLSFIPQQFNRRSYTWKRGMSSLKVSNM
ncbi:kinesin-like protein KIN-7F [Elaeis guineensis]|uniref:Kinesin-like protein KIN-7F n=1 Tax=Elaeis guineensis var. tenera TaxID=51953 RepID=A0A6I9RWV2_ELAGV|nr:kinesin-like protein KIN-7F [Elaeis guineensis]